ncbi:unnamed protein product [Microthlaspi erraticum]|uniref:Uncharacterized protein n=1 Tax=Microthlaspi erraticum TaxID=1685480 RepID=A0A6D2HR49_9BRAS|nr:unnamed protein product [Microthlaspi erraticum]
MESTKAETVKKIHEQARRNIEAKTKQYATCQQGPQRMVFEVGDKMDHLRSPEESTTTPTKLIFQDEPDLRTNPFQEGGDDMIMEEVAGNLDQEAAGELVAEEEQLEPEEAWKP